jgi:hypothetical protein
MWLLLVIGCGSECQEGPLLSANDGASQSLYADMREAAVEARQQLDHQCLSSLWLTRNAPEEGELWREPAGWTITVHPDEATERRVREQVCTTYAYEERKHLATDVFGPDPDAFDVFVQACADGPTEHRFPEQAVACGVLPPTPAEAFLDAEVFVGAPIPRAPDLPLTPGPELERRYAGSFSTMNVGPTARYQVRDGDLRIDGLEASTTHPLPDGRYWIAATGLGDRVVARDAFGDLAVIDLVTDEVRHIDLPDPQELYIPGGAAMLLLGDTVVFTSSSSWELIADDRLFTLDLTEASPTVRAVPLQPAVDAANAVSTRLWHDPAREAVWVRIVEADVDPNNTGAVVHRLALDHVDLQTGEQTRFPYPQHLPFRVFGGHPDGSVVIGTQVSPNLSRRPDMQTSGSWLVGRWNPWTGALTVSDEVCSYGNVIVLDDTLVAIGLADYEAETETWSTFTFD